MVYDVSLNLRVACHRHRCEKKLLSVNGLMKSGLSAPIGTGAFGWLQAAKWRRSCRRFRLQAANAGQGVHAFKSRVFCRPAGSG